MQAEMLLATEAGRAVEALRGASTAVVVGHVNPDGDALGSLLALTAALRALGVDARPAWGGRDATTPPAPLDAGLAFLPCTDLVGGPLPEAPDVLVCCDTAAAARLGTLQPLVDRAGTVVVVDHHDTGDGFGDIRVVDPAASSTGILALALVDSLGVALDPGIASALYLAILTDTGRFSFASTTPADHRAAARLIEAGADHVGVARAVYESATAGYLPLVARVAQRAVVGPALTWSWTTQADLVEADAGDHETDALIELVRKVDVSDVALFMRETPSGRWRCSLRSRGATDVSAIAGRFGGGGHRMAAGFTGDGDPSAIAEQVLALLPVEGAA